MPNINVPGLIALVVFYILILCVGIFAAWWKTKRKSGNAEEEAENVMVAGRNLGLFVGIFTMTATWVGGGYINGTAEAVYAYGLLHAQAPIGYALSLCIGGLLFARPMRQQKYLTMLDPFQIKYGKVIGGLLYIPALCGELFWSAAILSALGSSVSIIMDIDLRISIVVSACIAVFYTFFGGLYAVAYTDVVQLICIAFGLTLCIPFAWKNSHFMCWDMSEYAGATNTSLNFTCPTETCFSVMFNYTECNITSGKNITQVYDENWLGTIDPNAIGTYIDLFLLLIFGGIPWQVYFQRVLAVDEAWKAQVLSFSGSLGCIVMSIPPAIIGIIARHANWDATGFSLVKLLNNKLMVLPAVVQHLTPVAVSFFGLGAISAAVMSSSDSSILSASSMFAHNIYRTIFRQKASDKELLWVLRISILVCGALATLIALVVESVYGLWTLCSDFVYVILFPQLFAVIYLPFVNSYGVLAGYFFGLLLRLLGGEPALFLPAAIPFGGNVPFKTISMMLNFLVTVVVSLIAKHLCEGREQQNRLDILGVFRTEVGPSARVDWQELWHSSNKEPDYAVSRGKSTNGQKASKQSGQNGSGSKETGVPNPTFQTDV